MAVFDLLDDFKFILYLLYSALYIGNNGNQLLDIICESVETSNLVFFYSNFFTLRTHLVERDSYNGSAWIFISGCI